MEKKTLRDIGRKCRKTGPFTGEAFPRFADKYTNKHERKTQGSPRTKLDLEAHEAQPNVLVAPTLIFFHEAKGNKKWVQERVVTSNFLAKTADPFFI